LVIHPIEVESANFTNKKVRCAVSFFRNPRLELIYYVEGKIFPLTRKYPFGRIESLEPREPDGNGATKPAAWRRLVNLLAQPILRVAKRLTGVDFRSIPCVLKLHDGKSVKIRMKSWTFNMLISALVKNERAGLTGDEPEADQGWGIEARIEKVETALLRLWKRIRTDPMGWLKKDLWGWIRSDFWNWIKSDFRNWITNVLKWVRDRIVRPVLAYVANRRAIRRTRQENKNLARRDREPRTRTFRWPNPFRSRARATPAKPEDENGKQKNKQPVLRPQFVGALVLSMSVFLIAGKMSGLILTGDAEASRPVALNFEVRASSLNVRRAPSARAAVVDKLRGGEIVQVYGHKKQWAKISAPDAAVRWVHSGYLTRGPTGNGPAYSILNSRVVADGKLKVVVRLARKTQPADLSALALEIRNHVGGIYTSVLISYYLPGMKLSRRAWATANFDPELKVAVRR